MAHNLSPRFDTAGFPHIICIYAKYASAKDSFGPYDASQAFGASFCRHANNIHMAEEHPARSLKEAKSKTSPLKDTKEKPRTRRRTKENQNLTARGHREKRRKRESTAFTVQQAKATRKICVKKKRKKFADSNKGFPAHLVLMGRVT